jgi:hypothetical protein
MKNFVKFLFALLILAVVIGLLLMFGNKYQNDVQWAKDHPYAELVAPEKKGYERPTDAELAAKIKSAVLKTYGVSEFSEILYIDKNALLGQLLDIVPTNEGANDGEFTMHFIPEPVVGTWKIDDAVVAATEVMQVAGPDLKEVQGITADIEVWDFRGLHAGAVVSSNRVGREVLGEVPADEVATPPEDQSGGSSDDR